MIPRKTLGDIKSALLIVYRRNPRCVNWPVYFMELPDEGTLGDEDAACIKTMHETDVLPFPQKNCILISSQSWEKELGDVNLLCLYMSTGGPHPAPDNTPSNVVKTYLFPILNYVQGQSVWHVAHVARVHIEDDRDTLKSSIIDAGGEDGDYWAGCLPDGEHAWLTEFIDEQSFERRYTDASTRTPPNFYDGCRMLLAFLNACVPCHYRVVANLGDGFGPPSMKRKTQGKSIICSIPYDRLHSASIDLGHNGHEVDPHQRRGHFRHWWKAAGINRFALPDDPKERIKIAESFHVERSWIPPCWVGPRIITIDGITYKVDKQHMKQTA